ncbi:LysR family transcriptional regulator [Paraburkholderia acidisoli]|uniref:LysR family transcriptional regulator n=1 Tax=Paraburkholderia acidisoli TaxID=2571748 RepID=A0A7Z2GRV1_9BURK|nr:LysR family transcriptional regulator [Paraburkholderia acidisoli]QGZ66808.1 LysR family transcriptional regulator [Paraburkholderia acidisoli]
MAEKKRTEVDWQDVRVFLALGRHGSLSAAARALGVNHATISRRMQSLEATLGEKLAERRPEGYVLTPAGARALAVAGDMEASVQTLGRGGADDAPRGVVRVNAPPALSQGFLIRQLAELPILHEGLDIELATDLRSISLERHEADIAVRVDRPDDGDFIAKPVGTMAFGLYGTPAVCERVEAGAAPTFVSFDEAGAWLPDASWLAQHYPQARVAFRAGNHVAQAAAARAGVGLALLPHYVGRQEPELRLCRTGPERPPREIWLLIRRQDRKNLAVRTVVAHLTEVFEKARALFES